MSGRNYPIRVNVTYELRKRLRAYAAKNETSVASVIRKAVEDLLGRDEEDDKHDIE